MKIYCFVDQNKIQGVAKLPQKQRNCAKQSAIRAQAWIVVFFVQERILFPQFSVLLHPNSASVSVAGS